MNLSLSSILIRSDESVIHDSPQLVGVTSCTNKSQQHCPSKHAHFSSPPRFPIQLPYSSHVHLHLIVVVMAVRKVQPGRRETPTARLIFRKWRKGAELRICKRGDDHYIKVGIGCKKQCATQYVPICLAYSLSRSGSSQGCRAREGRASSS